MKEIARRRPGWGRCVESAKKDGHLAVPAEQEKCINIPAEQSAEERLAVNLPKRSSMAGNIKRCGMAIRKKHAAMLRGKIGFIGKARLVSFAPSLVTYALWIEREPVLT